jgi:hypothetical protein
VVGATCLDRGQGSPEWHVHALRVGLLALMEGAERAPVRPADNSGADDSRQD